MLAAHWPRGRWIVAALALVASRAWLKDELSLCHRLYWSYSRATRCGEHGVCGVGARTPTRDPHARTAHAPIRARAAEHTSIVHQTRVPFPFPRSPVGGTPSTGLESAFLRVERNSRCLKNSLNGRGRGTMQKCLDRVTRMVCRPSFFLYGRNTSVAHQQRTRFWLGNRRAFGLTRFLVDRMEVEKES